MVELIVAAVISAILLSLIAVIFGNGLNAQQQGIERNALTARTSAQTILFNETGRDAVAAWLSPARDEVRAKVLTKTNVVICRAWAINTTSPLPTTSTLAYKEWRPPAAMPTAWTTLDSGAGLLLNPVIPGASAVEFNARSSAAPRLDLVIFANDERNAAEASVSTITLRPMKLVAAAGGACW